MGDGVALDHVPQQDHIDVAFQRLVPVPRIQALRLRESAAREVAAHALVQGRTLGLGQPGQGLPRFPVLVAKIPSIKDIMLCGCPF